jgi:hypothetical protein
MAKLWAETIDGSELRQAQANIDQAMAGARADARRSNPNAVAPVASAGPKKGTGWVEQKPTAPPPGVGIIDRMVNASLPHGAGSKAK